MAFREREARSISSSRVMSDSLLIIMLPPLKYLI